MRKRTSSGKAHRAIAGVSVGILLVGTAACGSSGGEAPAAGKGEVVLANWGGQQSDAEVKAFFEPFTDATGIKVVLDANPLPAQVKAQVDTKSVKWDVAVTGLDYVNQLNAEGEYYDAIPWDELNQDFVKGLQPAAHTKYAIGAYYFEWMVGSRTDAYPEGKAPTSFPEFFDVQQYPGKRTMTDSPVGMLEAALTGSGVSKNDLYPLDTDRAYKELDKIKSSVPKFYHLASEAVQMLSTEQVDSAIVSTSGVLPLQKAGVDMTWGYDHGVLGMDMWSLVHGSPNRANAVKLLDWLIDPERQAEFAKLNLNGPTNTDAFKHIDAELAAQLPSTPERVESMPLFDAVWWASRQQQLRDQYSNWLNG